MRTVNPQQTRPAEIAIMGVAAAVGLMTWIATMASAPRYSPHGPSQDTGNPVLFPILLAAAVIGGWLVPRRARLVALMLGLPGLVLSPFTTPRGDDDGLWLLIVPMMVVFIVMLVVAAGAGAWIRVGRKREALESRREMLRDRLHDARSTSARSARALRSRVHADREQWREMRAWEAKRRAEHEGPKDE